jgi:hypothetical protein
VIFSHKTATAGRGHHARAELALAWQSDYSDACRPFTQRCRMPSRSPILFWLLLAATLSVDAVASVLIFETKISQLSAALYLALTFGQLSVLCSWAVLFSSKVGMKWSVPFVVALPFAIIIHLAGSRMGQTTSLEPLIAFIGLLWLHVVCALTLLWLLKPTRLSAPLANVANQRPWQFALRHLLIVMTCLALLAFMLSHNDPIIRSLLSTVSLVAGNAILLMAIVGSMRPRLAWPLRLALALGVAVVIAAVCNQFGLAFADEMKVYAMFLIQSIIIWAWLELYLPRVDDAAAQIDAPLSPEATS